MSRAPTIMFDASLFETLLQPVLETPVGLKIMFLLTKKRIRRTSWAEDFRRIPTKECVCEYYFGMPTNVVQINRYEDSYKSGRYIVIQVLTVKQYFSDALRGLVKEEGSGDMLNVLHYLDRCIGLGVIHVSVKRRNKLVVKSKIKLSGKNLFMIGLAKRVLFKDIVINIENSRSQALAEHHKLGFFEKKL